MPPSKSSHHVADRPQTHTRRLAFNRATTCVMNNASRLAYAQNPLDVGATPPRLQSLLPDTLWSDPHAESQSHCFGQDYRSFRGSGVAKTSKFRAPRSSYHVHGQKWTFAWLWRRGRSMAQVRRRPGGTRLRKHQIARKCLKNGQRMLDTSSDDQPHTQRGCALALPAYNCHRRVKTGIGRKFVVGRQRTWKAS